ncbi:MAG: 16S rRNA (cytidine(1402)-2'-O)-methyltransferase [Chloroflexota bacterium]
MRAGGRALAAASPASPAQGGTLYVVATPIGNLADVTLRALEVLRSVPLIAAEDTRVTSRLLDRYNIQTRLTSWHARSAPGRLVSLLEHLRGGADLALVTDAGTPMISDPGDALVRAWTAEGGAVVPIPGASAVLAAVAATGIAGPRWVFEGFLPRSGRERRERLGAIATDLRGAVVYEAPSRVGPTLHDLVAACGADRPAALCRELTKLHEEIVRDTLGVLETRVADGAIAARGEFVIVVGAVPEGSLQAPGDPRADLTAADALAAGRADVARLVADGLTRSAAAKRVARERGLSRRSLYEPQD